MRGRETERKRERERERERERPTAADAISLPFSSKAPDRENDLARGLSPALPIRSVISLFARLMFVGDVLLFVVVGLLLLCASLLLHPFSVCGGRQTDR